MPLSLRAYEYNFKINRIQAYMLPKCVAPTCLTCGLCFLEMFRGGADISARKRHHGSRLLLIFIY